MKMLAEQPFFLSVLLGITAAAFLYVWSRGAPRVSGIVGLVALGLIPVVWLISFVIVTPEEQVRGVIESVAAGVEANDFDIVYDAIHPDRGDIRRRAEAELPRYEFTRAKVAAYRKIKILEDKTPRQAIADLNAAVRVSLNGQGIRDQAVLRRLFLLLEETPEGWKVIDYAHRPPVGPTDPYSNSGNTNWDELLGPS